MSSTSANRQNNLIEKLALDGFPTPVVVTDHALSIQYVNTQAGSLLQRDSSDLLNSPITELLVEPTLSTIENLGAVAEHKVHVRLPDDYTISCTIDCYPLEGMKGPPSRLFVIKTLENTGPKDPFRSLWVDRYLRAVNSAGVGVWEWDVTTDEVWYSDQLLKFIGHSGEEAPMLAHWLDSIHPDDMLQVQTSLQQHFEEKLPYDVVYRSNVDGSGYRYLRTRGQAEFDEDGTPLFMSGVLLDVTPEQAARALAQESQKRANIILNRSSSAVLTFNVAEASFSYINAPFTNITGYSFEDLQRLDESNSLSKLFEPKELDLVAVHIKQVLSSSDDEALELKCQLKHKDGHWLKVLSHMQVVKRSDEGEPVEILGSFVDLTPLYTAQSELQQLDKAYHNTFDQAAIGIANVAPDGQWLRVNEKLCSIVGYTKEELLSLTFQDITHPEDLELDLSHVHRLLNNEADTYSMEKRYITKTSDIVWVNLTVAIVRKSDHSPDFFISMIEDITQRKIIEQKLTRSNDALRRFAHSASHDLQEPLRKISAFSDRLFNRLEPQGLDEDSKFELTRLQDSAQRMSAMIKSILDLSRIDNAKLNLSPHSLSVLVDIFTNDASIAISESNATVKVVQDAELTVDKTTFVQVLTNVILNAINYASRETNPVIEVSATEPTRFSKQQVRIHDNGPGISENDAERAFAPFVRLNKDKTRKGSGIGLSICRQVIEAHDGEIYFDTSVENGACVVIELPSSQK